jgi:hypothetical protein
MQDHYTVISTKGDRRHTRTVISAGERDVPQADRASGVKHLILENRETRGLKRRRVG